MHASQDRILRTVLIVSVVALVGAVTLASPSVRNGMFRLGEVRTSVQGTFGNLSIEGIEGGLQAAGSLTLLKEEAEGQTYQPSRRVTSDIVTAGLAFNAVGVRWRSDAPTGTSAALQIRLGDGDTWTNWRTLEASEDAAVAGDPSMHVSDLLFVPQADQVQLALDLSTEQPTVTPTVSDVQVDFVDSADGPSAKAASIAAAATTSAAPPIIARTGWGANEAWMTWPPEQVPATKIIVHHTAGTDGGNDPAAVVRGIYYYHAVTLGWGDIGYNYLIDAQGRIYEGRAGGLNTVGGHTSGYNSGTVGVALIGTYDATPATPAAEQALANLSGYLSAKLDLDPLGSGPFQGISTPTLAGHRDYTQTLCPGTAEYARFGTIRQQASSYKASYLGTTYAGALVSVTGHVLEPDAAGTATLTFRNTGTAPWSNSGEAATVLTTFAPEGHASALHTAGWTSPSEIGTMQEATVGPGGSATFKVPLAGAGLGDTSDTFALARRGAGLIDGTGTTFTRSVRPALQGSVEPLPAPILLEGGTRSVVEVRITNTGSRTWTSSGDNPLALNLTQPKGRTSTFQDPSWPLPYRPLVLPSGEVPPDATVALRVPLRVPAAPGQFVEPMQPVVDKQGWVEGAEFNMHLAVTNPYQSELLERPIIVYASAGQMVQVTANLTNRSSVAWQPSGTGFVALESVTASAGGSTLKSGGWVSPTRPLTVPHAVQPGEHVSLTFPIVAPKGLGVFTETFRLVSDGQTSIDGSTFKLNVHVRQPFVAKVLEVTQPAPVAVGATARALVRIQNLGAASWQVGPSDAVRVTTAGPLRHASTLATETWTDPATPTLLAPPIVAPDQVATLAVDLSTAAPGTASDTFTLVSPTGVEVSGAQFTLTRTATSDGAAAPSGPLGASIRVGITPTTSGFPVSAAGPFTVADSAGQTIGSAASGQVQLGWNGSAYTVSGAVTGQSTQPLRVQAADNGVLTLPSFENRPSWNTSLNDNSFRNVLEARRGEDGQVWAINELPMELYLRGIAESSNGDNATYLQVMAVAERTYAEYVRSIGGKHASLGFDVDRTNDQVYRGYGFEQRSPDIVAAVDATKGLLVTYQGTVVVTPYFSQSDGRTRDWTEVWGGESKPWLVSVPVPENSGEQLLGHGVGMDASAARARAIAGKSRDDVLDDFYSGVVVEKKY